MRNWIINKTSEARLLLKDRAVKKAILKRSADALEKLGIGSALVGIFQDEDLGIYLGIGCITVSIILSILEARK